MSSSGDAFPNLQTTSDHVTFPPRLDILPARILLFYFDKSHARAVLKTKPVNDAFCIGVGQYRRIVADIVATTDTELRAFILAAGVVKDVSKLRKQDLATALILGDYRKAAAERTRITALHTRLEMKTEKLRDKIGEFKGSETRLATMDSFIEADSIIRFKRHKASILSPGWAVGEVYSHRYPTRYSLKSSVEGES